MSKAPPPPSSDLLRQELNALEDAVAADKEATAESTAQSASPRHKRPPVAAQPHRTPQKPK